MRALLRWIFVRHEVTILRAGAGIGIVTLVVTVACGIIMWLADPEAFPTNGRGMWWAVQTVTTVGYGDAVPRNVVGKSVAAIVMLTGIAFISVLTAAITAGLIESARHRISATRGADPIESKLDQINERLAALETALRERG
jgi:voltage-gated potassium channel